MARRRNRGLVEDVTELVAKLPWWVGVLLALALYAGLHAAAVRPITQATQLGQFGVTVVQTLGQTLAGIGQYLLPSLCLIGAAISAVQRHRRAKLLEHTTVNPVADALNGMSWQQFEQLVGESFRRQGYQVRETGQAGPDGGVDLELRREGELHLVQCKQWRAQRVGVDVVRELYGAMAAQGAAGGFVVTSGRFTDEAKRFASGRNVKLVDGDRFKQALAISAFQAGPTARPPRQPASSALPSCPACGKDMVLRSAKRGAQAGKSFWGCSSYPDCRGTRDAA